MTGGGAPFGPGPSSAPGAEPGKTVGSLLFVCGQNSIRSPMAEALARASLPRRLYLASAGVRHGERDPFVDAILAERGLSLGRRMPQDLDDLTDDFFDLIVTLAPEAHHVILDRTGTDAVEVEFWPMPDPSTIVGTRDQILDAYRQLLKRLERTIAERLAPRLG